MKEQKESVSGRVVKNSFWNSVMILFGRLGGLFFAAIIGRLLLPEKYGIYSLATAVALLIISFTNSGVNQTLSRYLSESLGKNRKREAASYYNFLFKIKLLLTLASAGVILLLAYPLTFFIFRKPDLLLPLMVSAAYIFCLSFQNLYEYIFYTIEKVKYLTFKEILLQTFKIIFVVFFLVSFPKENHASFVVLALMLSSITAIIFMRFNLKKKIGFVFKASTEKIEKRETVNFLKNVILSNISIFVFVYIDIIIIGIFLVPEYAGYYSAAFTIVGSLYGFISLAGILLPVFTQMKKENISNAFNKVFKYISIISIPLIFGLIVLGKYVLTAVYGPAYLQATLPLIFLSLLIFEFPVTNSLNSLFYAKGMPKEVAKVSLSSLFLKLVLGLIFILVLLKFSTETGAMTGVAIATLISRFLALALLSRNAKKKLGVKYTLGPVIKPLIAGAIMVCVLIFINFFYQDMTLLLGIIQFILGAFIYFILMILIKGITKEDWGLLRILKFPF